MIKIYTSKKWELERFFEWTIVQLEFIVFSPRFNSVQVSDLSTKLNYCVSTLFTTKVNGRFWAIVCQSFGIK